MISPKTMVCINNYYNNKYVYLVIKHEKFIIKTSLNRKI